MVYLKKVISIGTVYFLATLLSGCGLFLATSASKDVGLQARDVAKHYPQIRRIVVEEAANNGYSALTSEVKPTNQNGWNGALYFSTVTSYGTDTFKVKFSGAGDMVNVHFSGAGMVGNPQQATESIITRFKSVN